ncbi:hypothetical protein [Azorhizobium caulinodans]|uniref:hypothetical protein n=1 Tax=Azorhizobium caulinodans TaxID=7 RepID=UPI002FBE3392
MAWSQFEDRELHRVRSEISYAALQLKLLRFGLEQRYRVDQPRAPAGSPSGGQWIDGESAGTPSRPNQQHIRVRQDETGEESWLYHSTHHRPDGSLASEHVLNRDGSRIFSEYNTPDGTDDWDTRHTVEDIDGSVLVVENAGNSQTIRDGRGDLLSQSVWGKHGPETADQVQPAYFPTRQTQQLLSALFTWMSTNGISPLLTYKIGEYFKENPASFQVIYIGQPDTETLSGACKRLAEVQKYTDESASKLRRENYDSAASYGTAVHVELDKRIKALHDPDLASEKSYLKNEDENDARRGEKGSIRVDVLEAAPQNTVCVYDIKTGKSGLSQARMTEIAFAAQKFRPNTRRILVTEMRPRSR